MTRRIHLIALAAVLAAGCSDNRSSIEILGRAAPTGVPACTFAAGGAFLGGPGQLNLSTTSAVRTYQQVLYVSNKLLDPSKANTATIATSKAWRALAAKVRVNPSDYLADFPPSPNLVAWSGEARLPLDGQTIEVGGNGVQFVSMVPQAIGDALNGALGANAAGTVVLGVTLEGQTLDGASLDTGEWFFALTVCKGTACLVPVCAAPAVASTCNGFGGLSAQQDPVGCVTP